MYHRVTGKPIQVSTGEIAKIESSKLYESKYHDYEIRETPDGGSFMRFRDHGLKVEAFEEDIKKAISRPENEWKGPSWNAFAYAVGKARPISIITARGHSENTIKKGLYLFYKKGYISKEPNYLNIFALNNEKTRNSLAKDDDLSVSTLKKLAVIRSVETAMEKYGYNVNHKFGVSDDNMKNMKQIYKAMKVMKKKYSKNEFYCFHMDGAKKVINIL